MKRNDRPGRGGRTPRRRRPATHTCPACAGACTQPIERPTDHDCRTAAKRRRRDR